MKDLTKVEETILLAVFRLEKDAYGVTIKNLIHQTTGRDYLYSTLYTALDQLVKKNYLRKRWGDPSPIRGGKRKIYFNLTRLGEAALKAAYENQQSIWSGINEDSFNRGYSK